MSTFQGKVLLEPELEQEFAERVGVMTTGFGTNTKRIELRLNAPGLPDTKRDLLLNHLTEYLRTALTISSEWINGVRIVTAGYDDNERYIDPMIAITVKDATLLRDETEDRIIAMVDSFLAVFGKQSNFKFFVVKGRQQLLPLRFVVNEPYDHKLSVTLPADLHLVFGRRAISQKDKLGFRDAVVMFENTLASMLRAYYNDVSDLNVYTHGELQLVVYFTGSRQPNAFALNKMQDIICTAFNLHARPSHILWSEVVALPTERHDDTECTD
jgi:hypothetical protein